jgi:acyl-CoA thioester hydrolase
MISVSRAVAHPWNCDVLGHMTTRFYVAMFDDAAYQFLFELFSWVGAQDAAGRLAWADVRHVIDYRAEVSAGDLLDIRAGLRKVGGKSITVEYKMINLGSGEVAATLECISVLFDLEARAAVTIPESLRRAAERHLAEPATDAG